MGYRLLCKHGAKLDCLRELVRGARDDDDATLACGFQPLLKLTLGIDEGALDVLAHGAADVVGVKAGVLLVELAIRVDIAGISGVIVRRVSPNHSHPSRRTSVWEGDGSGGALLIRLLANNTDDGLLGLPRPRPLDGNPDGVATIQQFPVLVDDVHHDGLSHLDVGLAALDVAVDEDEMRRARFVRIAALLLDAPSVKHVPTHVAQVDHVVHLLRESGVVFENLVEELVELLVSLIIREGADGPRI